jgi:hypothetical protein
MANVVDGNPLIISVEGIVSTIPLRIQKIILKPAATGDAATLNYWLESDTVADSGTAEDLTVTASTGTWAASNAFTTALVDPDNIIRTYISESAKNIGVWQIATNADNDTITVDIQASPLGGGVATLENDTANRYTWKVWDPHLFLTIKGSGMTSTGADLSLVQVDFGDRGFWVPNLAMNTLSTSAVLYIYLNN